MSKGIFPATGVGPAMANNTYTPVVAPVATCPPTWYPSTRCNVKVDTDAKGAVVLSGKVKTQDEADKAVSIATATEGVTSVKSNLQIKKDD